MKNAKIYTDGACSGNPGPGGYGTIVEIDGERTELSKGYKKTTNNRMELRAVLAGLELLNEPHEVEIYSDSKYVIDAIRLKWAERWRANDWMRNKKEKALNPDLWGKLLDLLKPHKVTLNWVKGHAGHPENERCDELAVAASLGLDLEDDPRS
ncbi:MAG: ribonuclease HI [Calditrichaceae bacterium]